MVFYIQKNLNFTVVTMKEELWLCATAGGAEKVKIFFFLHNCEQLKKIFWLSILFVQFWKIEIFERKMNHGWGVRTVSHIPVCTVQYSCSTTLNISTLKCQLSKWHWVTFINCKAHTSKISSHNLRMRPSGRRVGVGRSQKTGTQQSPTMRAERLVEINLFKLGMLDAWLKLEVRRAFSFQS